MASIQNTALKLSSLLKAAGISKFALSLTESEKRELNTEHVNFSLYRTLFDRSASVTAYLDGRKGSASGNDLTDEGLLQLVEDAKAGALSSGPDEANDIAPRQEPQVFEHGPLNPDMEGFYDRLAELIDTVSKEYPLIRLGQIIGSHTRTHRLYLNSNGTCFEKLDGRYDAMLEFAGNDGDRTTGLAYGSVTISGLKKPILEYGSLRRQLSETEKSLTTVPVGDKFEGTVIFTPDALGQFIWMLLDNYVSDGVIMNGTSRWLKCLGEQVVSPKLTLRMVTEDPRLAVTSSYTGDGYRAEDVTILDQGVLRSFLLNLYAAKKTGQAVTKNDGSRLIMEPGDTALSDMIRRVSRGLIVGGFSGGEPGVNGEFSGVAKNSFYVENGEVKGAVMETMISGNLTDVFSNVTAVSKELVSDGTFAFPWMAAEGVTVSGK